MPGVIYAELKGVQFRPAEAKEIVKVLSEGTELTLRRDASNEYDSNAIQVLYTNLDPEYGPVAEEEFIGFIERGIAMDLAPRIDAGEEFNTRVYSRSGTIALTLEITQDDESVEDNPAEASTDPEVAGPVTPPDGA